MVVSGYTLELYCDCYACENATPVFGTNKPWTYAGETYTECAKEARKEGWYISRDKQKCIAPGHDRS